MGTITNPSYRKRLLYHAGLLGSMGLFASLVLVMGNISTHKDIELRAKEDMQSSLQEVVPSNIYDNDLFEDSIIINSKIKLSQNSDVKVYRARKKNKIVAIAFQTIGIGYSGDINVIMGVDENGTLLGVRIISHSETPGLGDKIEVKKDDWITKFSGLSLFNPLPEKWKVKKDGGEFDQFTGATITPRAVIKAISKGLQFVNNNKQKLFIKSNNKNVESKK